MYNMKKVRKNSAYCHDEAGRSFIKGYYCRTWSCKCLSSPFLWPFVLCFPSLDGYSPRGDTSRISNTKTILWQFIEDIIVYNEIEKGCYQFIQNIIVYNWVKKKAARYNLILTDRLMFLRKKNNPWIKMLIQFNIVTIDDPNKKKNVNK